MKNILFLIITFLCAGNVCAATLHVGTGQPYQTFVKAATAAVPGDTILLHAGIYGGNQRFVNLQGVQGKPIVITAATGDTVICRGGSGWQLSDAAHLVISNLIFEKQTANGFNIDDGWAYESPSHHVVIENCVFRDIDASGNNDLLKLSGLDSFEIRHCVFLNGARGGSGIDMVGCHYGVIEKCRFENMGSNAVQTKGGSQFIRISNNVFKNCGMRSVNLGGSTGLQFFRPVDALFEAADLQVYANVFIGSDAPVAFVGCIRAEVVNNTLYMPGRWAVRILQETIDPTRFAPCGNNVFRNNIIYQSNKPSPDCNISGNTNPQSFYFSNNLWYNYEDARRSYPRGLPVPDENSIIGANPLFNDAQGGNFSIPAHSPAAGKGYAVTLPLLDFADTPFAPARAIGAFEATQPK